LGSKTYNKTGTILTYEEFKKKFPRAKLSGFNKNKLNNSNVSYINTKSGKKKYFSSTQNNNPKLLNEDNINSV
jgi:hypothetical protein